MKDEKQVPELRFPEFEGEWANKTINDVLNIGGGKDYKHLNKGNIPVYGTGGCMTYVDNFLYDGESVCIGRKGTIDKPMLIRGKFWTVDTLFYTHEFKSIDPKFVYLLFQNINWQKYNEASGVPSLSKATIEKIPIIIPNLSEQQKIAAFLTAVDQRIQLLQTKKAKLEEYKKGVMQKLFPNSGSGQTPTLRFKDDDGNDFPDWQEKKLGDVFEHRSERAINKNLLLSVTLNQGVIPQYETNKRDISNSDKSNYKIVFKNDIVYNSMRMWQGASGVSNFEGIVSPAYTILKGNSFNSSLFFSYYFKIEPIIQIFQRNSQGLTSDTWNLKYPQLSSIKLRVPTLPEQQKIAAFLSSLDNSIETLTKEIDGTTTFKKSLLQKMFV